MDFKDVLYNCSKKFLKFDFDEYVLFSYSLNNKNCIQNLIISHYFSTIISHFSLLLFLIISQLKCRKCILLNFYCFLNYFWKKWKIFDSDIISNLILQFYILNSYNFKLLYSESISDFVISVRITCKIFIKFLIF